MSQRHGLTKNQNQKMLLPQMTARRWSEWLLSSLGPVCLKQSAARIHGAKNYTSKGPSRRRDMGEGGEDAIMQSNGRGTTT